MPHWSGTAGGCCSGQSLLQEEGCAFHLCSAAKGPANPSARHATESSKSAQDNEMAQWRLTLWHCLKRDTKEKRKTSQHTEKEKCLKLPVTRDVRPEDVLPLASIIAVTERTKPQTYLSKAERTFPVQQELYKLRKAEEFLF